MGPFLQRLHTDRFMRVLFELTVQLYEILLRVDRSVDQLVRDKLVKLVKTEEQMLFIFHLVRLRAERRLSSQY